ncbi:hypothetical protein E2F48_11490 [Arthrobacter crusticola]|uniref:Uncharacterized protein n=1 Tax=Arthrobacter crusticola TaxID=2547960 RepID=A0A4V3AMA5_9MICC|nr:hypothetical protein [Arthrobacter crusticola]TDK25839.1 hypothetical protein E2F48_11490 [Arthrobacter crusticola]
MTAQPAGPSMGNPSTDRQTLDEPAAMRFTSAGTPLALRWRGSIWQVIGEPIQWSSSNNWWEPDSTARGGHGSVITTRSWRFRAQTGPASPVLEFDISADSRWQDWRLHRVTGATGF